MKEQPLNYYGNEPSPSPGEDKRIIGKVAWLAALYLSAFAAGAVYAQYRSGVINLNWVIVFLLIAVIPLGGGLWYLLRRHSWFTKRVLALAVLSFAVHATAAGDARDATQLQTPTGRLFPPPPWYLEETNQARTPTVYQYDIANIRARDVTASNWWDWDGHQYAYDYVVSFTNMVDPEGVTIGFMSSTNNGRTWRQEYYWVKTWVSENEVEQPVNYTRCIFDSAWNPIWTNRGPYDECPPADAVDATWGACFAKTPSRSSYLLVLTTNNPEPEPEIPASAEAPTTETLVETNYPNVLVTNSTVIYGLVPTPPQTAGLLLGIAVVVGMIFVIALGIYIVEKVIINVPPRNPDPYPDDPGTNQPPA